MQLSSTTTLTVELYPNRDGNALVAGTDYKARGIKVSLCEGQTVEKLKNGTYTGEKILFDAAADNADFSGVEQSGTLIKITKLLPADTKPGLYRINVTGTDVKNNSGFVPYGEGNKPSEGYFIVKLEATGSPYIFFRALNTYQKSDFDIYCDVKNLSGGKVDYKFDADPTGSPASSGPSLLTLDSPGVYRKTVSTSGLAEGNHTVHVRAYKSDVLFNTAYVPFIFDKTAPSPAVLTDPVETENYTFSTWSHTFKGTAADTLPSGLQLSEISNIDKITYRVGTKANSSAPIVYKPTESPATLIDPVSSSDPYKWEAVVSFGQKKDNYLRVSVYDKAGNKTDTDFGPYEVNTDSPQVKFEDVRFSLGTTYSESSPVTLVKQNTVIGNGVNENNKKASFKIFAYSAFEIESVKVSVGGGEKAGTKTGTSTDGYEEWTVNDVPLVEGNPNFKLYVKSKSGTLTEWQTPIIVDFTAPKVKQSSPDLHGIFFKEIQLMGTITDEVPSGSGIASGADADTVKYEIGNSGFVTVHNPGGVEWSKLTYSGGAWTINISDIARYTTAYGASVPSGSTIHSIPIQIQVTDKAGNRCTSDAFTIKFDPAGGAPFADLTAPKQGDRLGGDILISGSAHVANPASGKTVKEIYLQMGETQAALESNTAWNLNSTDYGAASGVKIYPSSGSADVYYWNYTLPSEVRADILGSNTSKEVFLRVRAKNGDGVFSEWTQPISFTINTDVAKFSSIQLQKGSETPNPYTPNSVWLKGDDFKITGSVSHSAGIQNTIKAESAAQLPQGYERLDISNTTGWFTQTTIGSDQGYTFTIPIKTSGYAQKAGHIQFDISAIDARSDGTPVPVSYPITLKYDNSKPTVTAGVHKVKSDTAVFTGGQFTANLDNTKKDLYRVLVDNKVYKVHSITGTNVVLSGASSLTGSFDYGIVEQPKMIYDDGSDYQIQGIASDTGSGVQKVTAKLEVVKGTELKTVSVDMTTDHASNKISTERGNMVSFKGSLNTEGVPNGKGRLTVTAYDGNGNEFSETITDVIVKNKPVEIKKIIFKTDLSGDGDYNDPNETFESTNIGSLDANRDFSGTVNAASEFTFKNLTTSQLSVTLKGGYGDNVKVSLLNGNNVVKSVSATPNAAGNEYNVNLDLSNVLNIGDAEEKALVLKVEDESIGTVPPDPPAPPTPAPTSPYWHAQADITVGLDVVDDVKPTGFIMPFFYNSDDSRITKPADLPLVSVVYDVVKNSEGAITEVKEPLGHIEISGISSLNANPCVSGKVKLRGIAYDNIRLKKLELSGAGISGVSNEFTNGAWSATSPLKIVKKGLSNTGHYVEWEYEWNTGTPAKAQTVTLKVTDAADKTNAAGKTEPAEKTGTRKGDRGMTLHADHTAVKHQFIRLYQGEKSYLVQVDTVSTDGKTVAWKDTSVPTDITTYRLYDNASNNVEFAVNVVPYITGIENAAGQGLSNSVIRASDGTYSMNYSDSTDPSKIEKMTVKGFNLKPASGDPTATIGSSTPAVSNVTATSIQVSKKASSGALVITVGTVESINNMVDITKPYNQEKDITNPSSNLWNAKRELVFWENKQVCSSTQDQTFYYPSMVMNGNQPIFAYCNNNDGFTWRTDNDSTSDQKGGKWFARNAVLAKTSDNKYMILSNEDNFTYGYSGYLYLNSNDKGYNFPKSALIGYEGYNTSYVSQDGFIELCNTSYGNSGWDKPSLNRFKYPNLIVDGSNNSAQIYISYYDSKAQEIRFFAFKKTGADTTNLTEAGHRYGNPRGLAENGTLVVSGTNDGKSSEHTAMAKVGSEIYIAYYDAASTTLKLAYSKAPLLTTGLANTAAAWDTLEVDNGTLTGQYVSMTSSGTKLYIAYHDAANAALKLAVVETSGAAAAVTSKVIVDAYQSVGYKTGITMVNGLPYISYYNNAQAGTKSTIKLAYPKNTASIGLAGAKTSGAFTGNWISMYIPSIGVPNVSIPEFNRVMINVDSSAKPVLAWLGDPFIEYTKLK